MRRTWLVVTALTLLVTACGLRDGEIAVEDDDPDPEPTATVTVTATPDPEPEPDDDPDEEPDEEPPAAEDPCDDPPTGQDMIFVTTPRVGDEVSSPFTVEGCSSTFEANVVWELYGEDGGLLEEGFTMGGTMGEPDDFSFEVSYTVTSEQTGTLKVFETSAQDGSELHVNSIQLVLTP